MPAVRKKRQHEENPYFKNYATIEEAAQEKTDHAWNTVFKHVDWNKFEEMRKKQ